MEEFKEIQMFALRKVRTIWFILIVEVINVVVSHVMAHFVMIEPALKYRFLQLSDLEQENEKKQSFYVERKHIKIQFFRTMSSLMRNSVMSLTKRYNKEQYWRQYKHLPRLLTFSSLRPLSTSSVRPSSEQELEVNIPMIRKMERICRSPGLAWIVVFTTFC